MARHPLTRNSWHTLRRFMPSGPEMQDYQQLSKDVLLVLAGFIVLGLLFGFAVGMLPGLLHI